VFGLSLQRLHWMNQYRIFTRCISKSRFLRSRLNPVFCKSQPDSLIFRYKQKILVSQRWTNKEYSFTRCIWLLESVTIQNPHDKGVCLDLTKHNESHKTIVSVHALNLSFYTDGHSYKTIGLVPKSIILHVTGQQSHQTCSSQFHVPHMLAIPYVMMEKLYTGWWILFTTFRISGKMETSASSKIA